MIKSIKKYIYETDLKTLYYTMIYPYLTYGIESWGSASKQELNKKLEKMQNRVVRCIGSAQFLERNEIFYKRYHILKLNELHELHTLKQMHMYYLNETPLPISELFVRNHNIHDHNTRQN